MTDTAHTAPDDGVLAELRAHNASLQQQLKDAEDGATLRVQQAELKAEAIRAGMIDLDGLRLIDPGSLALDAQGHLPGPATVMAQLRRDKPWLFNAGNSSSSAQAPPSTVGKPKLATDMTLEEWRVARAELLRRR